MIEPAFVKRQGQFASRRTAANNGKPFRQASGKKIIKCLLKFGDWFNRNYMISRSLDSAKALALSRERLIM